MGWSRKPKWAQVHRGFESPPLRQSPRPTGGVPGRHRHATRRGRAQSRFAIPNDQAFVGFFLCTNYVVLDPAWRSPFRGLANPLSFQTAQ